MSRLRKCLGLVAILSLASGGCVTTATIRRYRGPTIEATIAHFKLVMEGFKPPVGDVYGYTESANGELGFYIVSDGSGTPYRVRVRPPCWYGLQASREMMPGGMLADIVPTFGTINMIGGECDR